MRKKLIRGLMVNSLLVLLIVFNVKPVLAASLPSPMVSGSVTYNSITVQYSSSSKVSGFEVTSSSSEMGAYTLVSSGIKASFTFTKLAVGSTLYIKVKAYVNSGSKKVYSNETKIVLQTSLNAVVLKGKTVKGLNTLTWAKIAGATSYEISSSTSYSGSYKVLTSVNTLTYTDRVGLKKGVYYKVRAFTLAKGTKVFGPYSNILLLKS